MSVHFLEPAEAVAKIGRGEIQDAKTIIGILLMSGVHDDRS
jgi:hypothetical protein